MRSVLIWLFLTLAVFAFLFFGIQYKFQNETAFVILIDKVGNPTTMTTFRTDPNALALKDPNYCQVDEIYTPWNISVFSAAQKGDVLRRYHSTSHYQIFDKTIWQKCEDRYMPIRLVALYPDMNYWPFKKGSIDENDPNYKDIERLIKLNNAD